MSIPENPTRLEDLPPFFDVIYCRCRARKFDEAITIFQSYGNGIRESLIYRFGVYEFFLSLIREFFPNRNLNTLPFVTGLKNQNTLLNLVSYCLRRLGRLVEAKKVSLQFLSTQAEPNEDNEGILTYQSLGVIDTDLGNLPEAKNILSQAAEIVQNTQGTQNKIRAFASLGWVCFLRGEIELARKYYNQANQIGYQTRGYGVFSMLGGQYATFLLMTGNVQDSQRYTEDNLARCIEKHWPEAVSYCKCLLGDIAVMETRLIEARNFYF
ncbi:MAG: tetratricopeptide repeat protein [Chloroflexi bacterium]|nr:tetratricopeptide repeat protein [Chloroflexota bacterium]